MKKNYIKNILLFSVSCISISMYATSPSLEEGILLRMGTDKAASSLYEHLMQDAAKYARELRLTPEQFRKLLGMQAVYESARIALINSRVDMNPNAPKLLQQYAHSEAVKNAKIAREFVEQKSPHIARELGISSEELKNKFAQLETIIQSKYEGMREEFNENQ